MNICIKNVSLPVQSISPVHHAVIETSYHSTILKAMVLNVLLTRIRLYASSISNKDCIL